MSYYVAFQICWRLWSAKWNARGKKNRKPRILYLADRNILIDDPKDKQFAPFGAALARASIPMRDVVAFERGRFTPRPRNDPRFLGGEHPWIQIGEIEAADKYIRGWTRSLNDQGLAVSRKFPAGTVLVSIAATIGSVGILGFDCCVPDSVVAAVPTSDVDSEFVYYYLSYLRGHLEKLAPQSAQKNINLRILQSLPFPRVPRGEQRRIVDFLDRIRTQCSAIARVQAQRTLLVNALMPSSVARELT